MGRVTRMKQPTPWSCYPTAVSILTGVPLLDIFEAIGHDGAGIADASKPCPWCRDAFVQSEVALAMPQFGWCMSFVYAALEKRPTYPSLEDLKRTLEQRGDPVVVCVRKSLGDHALAWDVRGERVIDPLTGEDYEGDYPIVSFEPLHRITEASRTRGVRRARRRTPAARAAG